MTTAPNLKKTSPLGSKPVRIALAVAASFACVCIALAAALSSADPAPAPSTQATEPPVILPTHTPQPTAILDPQAAFRAEIEKALGESNRGVPRVTAVNFHDPEPGAIFVNWSLNDNLSLEMVGGMARTDATSIIQALANSGIDYTFVIISGSFPLVDDFGNQTEARVFNLTFSKSTVDKINWENFDKDKIDNIADDAFIRVEFQDE